MTNATAITVTDLVKEAVNDIPTADVLDTGQVAVTLSADVKGRSDLILLEVTNSMGSGKDLTVTILAGDYPPAARASLGSLALTVPGSASPVTKLIGPVESARFIQDNGKIDITFTPPASTTLNVAIRCYKMPKVV